MISIIIPHKNCTKERLDNAIATINYYESLRIPLEIIVVEQDTKSLEGFGDKYIHFKQPIDEIHNEHVMLLSRARNLGVKNAEHDYVMVVDNDMIVSEKNIQKGIEISKDNSLYFPIHKTMYDLDYDETHSFLTEEILPKKIREKGFRWTKTGSTFGGVIIMMKKDYERIGGYSESFIGYGAEDDEFGARAGRNGLKIVRSSDSYNDIVFHLKHEFSKHVKSKYRELNKEILYSKLILRSDWLKLQIKHYKNPTKKIGAIHYNITAENVDEFYNEDLCMIDNQLKTIKMFKSSLN